MKEGDTVLLDLLRQKCGCTVQDVCRILDDAGDEDAQTRLVNTKCVEGFTPLMLAVGGGGGFGNKKSKEMTAVARFLLSRGAAASLGAHSNKRRTAADYADLHRKPWLARELRELELEHNRKWQQDQQEQEALDGQGPKQESPGDIAIQMPGEKHFRCRICNDRLGGCKFRLARKDVESGKQTNPLIAQFFSDNGLGSSSAIQEALSNPALHNFNARKRFTKELTEVLGMMVRLQRIVATSKDPEQSWHVIDLCCGKGFLATLAAICYPSFVVTAVDRLLDNYLPHYDAAGIVNVRYAQLDVMSTVFPDEIYRIVKDKDHGDGRPVVIMGMHLCGLLSIRALELIRKVPGVRGVVLAPCCLPCQKLSEDTPASIYEGRDNWEKFLRWCDFLEARMKQEAQSAWVTTSAPTTPPPEDTKAPLDGAGHCSQPCGHETPSSEPTGTAANDSPPAETAAECCSVTHHFSREADEGIMSEKRILLSAHQHP